MRQDVKYLNHPAMDLSLNHYLCFETMQRLRVAESQPNLGKYNMSLYAETWNHAIIGLQALSGHIR
jgi:hypothetical protein